MLKIIIFILILISILIIEIVGSIWTFKLLKEIVRKNDIKDREVRNELNRIYMDIDVKKCEEIIDYWLKKYRDQWVLINIIPSGSDYIKADQVEELIKYITTMFIAEMSDVSLFYIKCITNISDDDDLIRWVRNKTKFIVLDFITEFNQPQ